MNLLFFFLLPMACFSSLLCCPFSRNVEQDSEASIQGVKISRKEMDEEENTDEESFDEYKELLRKPKKTSISNSNDKYRQSSETVFDVNNKKARDYLNEELEKDARFVVDAMNESHESLRKLVSK